MKTYEKFEEFLKSKPKKLSSLYVWEPRKHWQFWVYTILIIIVPKKYKAYWFTKRCNFIHKPMMDAFKKLRYVDSKR